MEDLIGLTIVEYEIKLSSTHWDSMYETDVVDIYTEDGVWHELKPATKCKLVSVSGNLGWMINHEITDFRVVEQDKLVCYALFTEEHAALFVWELV